MGILSGKKALVLGIANERSLAFAIARRLADEGAALAVTYQGAALEARVRKLAEALPAATVVPCDVTSDAEISSLFERVEQELGGLTLSYYGAEKVVRNYNVMGVAKAALEASVRYLAADLGPRGIRVNAISAGPVKTLSAKGVRDFNSVLSQVEERAPLRRNITSGEVGAAGFFLLSDLSGGMTGEIIHVDAGYNIIGL
jgi:enoyl-[acyl-carrier protein] reductase I